MTEQEKRALALQIMVQETAMLRSHTRTFHEENKQQLNASLQRTAKQRQVFSNLAQDGITWNQLREAYHEAFKAGHDEMLTFKLSFFYAGSVIAYHETFGSEAEETAAFVQQMCDIAEDYPDRHSIEEKCLAETGINTAFYDESDRLLERLVHRCRHGCMLCERGAGATEVS